MLLREFGLRGDDLCAKVFHDLPLNDLARESTRNLHGREKCDGIGQAKYATHERGIFVGRGVVDGDPALTDGLHEPSVQPLRAERGKESE